MLPKSDLTIYDETNIKKKAKKEGNPRTGHLLMADTS
jgi:hypothetical protein